MKKCWIIIIVLLVGITACGIYEQKIEIPDVSVKKTFILKKDPDQGHIHRLEIQFVGELDGDAEMTLILNGEPYDTAELSGTFDLMYSGDWYTDSAELIYQPSGVKSGHFKIIYQFFD